jgi:anti-sigma factor RsiW
VQCVEITERLLEIEPGGDAEVDRHVAECARCAHVAHGLRRLDGVFRATFVVAPPLDLQRQLAQLALDSARPQALPWWRRLGELKVSGWLAQQPQMVAAQGLAAVMLALASWQIFGLVSTFQPVVGDVGYAMELVAGSPAAAYLSGLQIDVQSLGVWSVVGIVGWLVSEDGLIGRRLSSTRLRLP